jgi:hypothetical protein
MNAKVKALLVFGAFAVIAAGTAQAQILPIAGCAQAKIKCEINYLKGQLGCEGKAAKGGIAVDPLCTGKVNGKFTTAGTGCMEKAEAKFPAGPTPCEAYGDAGTQKGKLDTFIANLKSTLYVNPAPTAANACVAGQYKCVANLQKGLLGCDNKGIKGGVPVDSTCVAKVLSKFTNTLAKGCMDKLEAAGKACTLSGTTGSAPGVLASTLTSIAETGCDQAPTGQTVKQTNQVGAGNCGTTDGSVNPNLLCSDLYIGGGASTTPAGATPPGSNTQFNVGGANDRLCARTAAQTGSSRNCTDVGCFFGSPLPIVNGPLSTCVDNTFLQRGGGQLIPTTGDAIANLPLQSTVTVTGNATRPCPLCSLPTGGTCSADAVNAGASCSQDATTGQSHDCIAAGPVLSPFAVTLAPITTGSATKTNASGLFCPSQANAGAFGDGTVKTITTTGSAPGNLTTGPALAGTLGSVFCIPATGNVLIDGAADLPGPGAVTLPVLVDLLP